MVYRCIELGAAGYLPKLTAGDDICAAVAALARGESVVPAQLQAGLASEIRLRRSDDRPVLTPREFDIIRLAADGHSNAEIGLRLHVSTATVKTHLQHASRSSRFGSLGRRGAGAAPRPARVAHRGPNIHPEVAEWLMAVSRARASIRRNSSGGTTI